MIRWLSLHWSELLIVLFGSLLGFGLTFFSHHLFLYTNKRKDGQAVRAYLNEEIKDMCTVLQNNLDRGERLEGKVLILTPFWDSAISSGDLMSLKHDKKYLKGVAEIYRLANTLAEAEFSDYRSNKAQKVIDAAKELGIIKKGG